VKNLIPFSTNNHETMKNFFIPHHLKILGAVSLIIIASIIFMVLKKKRVFVIINVEVAKVTFQLKEDISNFLSIEDKVIGINKINISSFYYAIINSDTIYSSNEPSNQIVFNTPNIANLNLNTGTTAELSILSPYRLKLYLANFKRDFSIIPRNDSSFFSSDILKEADSVYTYNSTVIYPLDDRIEIDFEADTSVFIEEGDVFNINNLKFTRGEKQQSSILSGNVYIEDLSKSIELSKNCKLVLNSNEEFTITSLTIYGSIIHLTMEGYTDELYIGNYNRNNAPSILEYLYNNNYLIILFNSFMAILNFYLFLLSQYKARKD
jgi:hypothetical protein